MKKILIATICLLIAIISIDKNEISKSFKKSGNKYEIKDTSKPNSYDHFLKDVTDANSPENINVQIPGGNYDTSNTTNEVEYLDNLGLLTKDLGNTSWKVNVPIEGYYNMQVEYYPYEGKSSNVERKVFINNVIQYENLDNVIFQRIWGNKTDEKIYDNNGNQIRPMQIEKPMNRTVYVSDDLGYYTEPYIFKFNQGDNMITFESIKEPLVVKSISIVSIQDKYSYSEYKNSVKDKTNELSKDVIRIEAEDAIYKSSPTLYPIVDRSSPINSPTDLKKVRLNSMGGVNWKVPGDFIVWDFNVEKSGYYNISLRAKQSSVRGMYSSRKIYIDDQLLFDEMNDIKFKYSSKWQMVTLGNEDENFGIYLEKRSEPYQLRLEVTLGEYGILIKEIENLINDLNAIYREIIRYTGPTPDADRDYQLTTRIPTLLTDLQNCSDRLTRVSKSFEDVSGEKSDKTGIIDSVNQQVKDFIKNPRTIHKRIGQLNSRISSLGTLLTLTKELPLTLDYILVHSADYKLPKANANFFINIWYNIKSFFLSFFIDYNEIGSTSASKDTKIEVWMSNGRDQANIVRQLIDESFTPEKNIEVELKLVNSSVLLSATLAGRGPDVSMNAGSNIPVDYALRNALYDLSQFDDFEEIAKRFMPTAVSPFEFQNGYYALPETHDFLVMFVREDLMEQMNLKVPNTWQEVIEMIHDLGSLYRQFYLPVNNEGTAVLNTLFASLLYQNGGQFYSEDGRSALNEKAALDAFQQWTEFYVSYNFPTSADFSNRFRTGEMPIGVTSYTVYNTLSVFAPELRGKWNFYLVPGIEKVNDKNEKYIDRTVHGASSGVVMLNDCENKAAAWEYMKWWTSAETQVRYGREMEGILGAAARLNTANLEALEQLPWSRNEYQVLKEQLNYVRNFPNVPGGYITGREVENAFRLVLNQKVNSRETLIDYTRLINKEIERKRQEYNLD